jgi:hypothetical protein
MKNRKNSILSIPPFFSFGLHEFGEEYLMCEHGIEQEHKKKEAKDLSELDSFDIKITVPSIDIEVLIHTIDSLDCVELAGYVIRLLRDKNLEPKVVILP